ncbi:hypothetical protein QBC40DRAFT_295782 [Triangularia verruculosa]|uniref:PKD domain-containing protein n=1 Tax=Triangularia verruculosa TaxID=2587418 RepID=A0AAN6XIF4_9PEZI|nr:hypothetical protein QBC40DRAFT_295782 [Triangularia verruculosa]
MKPSMASASAFAVTSMAWLAVFGAVSADPKPIIETQALLCQPAFEGGPFRVTEDCVDPTYNVPVFTSETDETSPVPHRRVSGYFNGTKADFNFYLPPPELFKGRFFQHVYPIQDSNARPERVAFGAESGAYTVNVAGVGGYRADAAAAKLSRKVAAEYYLGHSGRIYGYIYGGSGGSYVTAGAMESTFGVWDGGMLLIQGIPMSNPNNWPVRALAGLFLEHQKKNIIDALAPGGSGDPFSVLSEDEQAILKEATALGIPLSSWEAFDDVGRNGMNMLGFFTPLVSGAIQARDPSYPHDFWSKPGYIGTEDSSLGDAFRNALVSFNSTVRNVVLGDGGLPVSAVLSNVPDSTSTLGLVFTIHGANFSAPVKGQLQPENNTLTIDPTSDETVLATLKEGIIVQVDNRLFLSGFALYRHQVPPVQDGYYGYDILRHPDGTPLYPQRDTLMAPLISQGASGGVLHSGNITAKVMVLQTLLDYDAWPWHADWYKRRVKTQLGDQFDNNYRLYYMENGFHYIESPQLEPPASGRVVPSGGHIEQHLLDLSDWVERGIEPPKGSEYTIDELSQVHLTPDVTRRGGIQPLATLTVGGANRTHAVVGEAVTFQLHVEAPPGTGGVVSTEWDFEGTGVYTALDFGRIGPMVETNVTHTYEKPGTFFAGVRVSSQRDSDPETPFARVWNLARMRVIVE